jgi:hypothetical protein
MPSAAEVVLTSTERADWLYGFWGRASSAEKHRMPHTVATADTSTTAISVIVWVLSHALWPVAGQQASPAENTSRALGLVAGSSLGIGVLLSSP